jgi:xanthine dehydrogenase accessory factor
VLRLVVPTQPRSVNAARLDGVGIIRVKTLVLAALVRQSVRDKVMARIYDQLPAILAAGEPFALGIISAIKGSSPQKKGAKALFFADGKIVGTMGGGCLEAEIQDRARRALRTGTPASFELVLDHDFGWDDGLICGGKVSGLILPQAAEAGEIWRELAQCQESKHWGVTKNYTIGWANEADESWLYQETVAPPCGLWIAGSGHVAQAVAPLALQLDFEVTVFDDRPTLANAQHFPEGTHFRVGYWESLLQEPMPKRPVFGLIVTRGHQHDALVLRHWIHAPFVFLGMIGSRRKARVIFTEFLAEKIVSEDDLKRVSCPVGLEIQAQSVPEIAVSILAQFIQKRAEYLYEKVDLHGGRAGLASPA